MRYGGGLHSARLPVRLLRLCCDDDAFLLPNPLDEERLSGEASWGGGGSSAMVRGRACLVWERARGRARTLARIESCAACRRDRNLNGDGGVGNEPSPELGNGTELRSETCNGDQGVQAAAHGGQDGHDGQWRASAGDDARNSGGAAEGRNGARSRGRNPPSSEEEGAGEGEGEDAGDSARTDDIRWIVAQ